MLPNLEIKSCSSCQRNIGRATLHLNGICNNCNLVGYNTLTDILKELFIKFQGLEQEFQTERASTQQALQTSQTWHERQKAEIIAEWKQKLTNLLNTRKQKITQELQLIREVLNE